VKRAELVEEKHSKLSIRKQCKLLHVSRSNLYYERVPEKPEDRAAMKTMDKIYTEDPCLGTRKLVTVLERDHGLKMNRKRIQRLRRSMGLETIWCQPRRMRTSCPDTTHRKYPYLLRGFVSRHADQVWASDITYIPMGQGHAYLCAVMDWHTRYVLGWAISNTMDAALVHEALDMARSNCGNLPEIFNTDQGSQFTSPQWTGRLEKLGIRVSMDGKGRWMDNVFVERLWRSLKHEEVYLKSYCTVGEARTGIGRWIERYNTWRPHAELGNRTPAKAYQEERENKRTAA
jgi:putative transposase